MPWLRRACAASALALLGACSGEDPVAERRPATETNDWGSIVCSEQTADYTCRTHRTILGVSMGGSGAGQIGLAHPELFDTVGMLGVPLLDWSYTLRLFGGHHLGGFCDMETILANLDSVADPEGPAWCGAVPGTVALEPSGTLIEPDMDFNNWFKAASDGVGADFDRDLLLESFQDVSLAFGNPFYANPEHPYLPNGLPLDFMERPHRERCAQPFVVEGFHDRRYNPTGEYPAVAFCDTSTDTGRFDPNKRDHAVEIALAVDYNRNGIRDWAEPVIANYHEPYEDIGGGDNDVYDWRDNPNGKAQNALWDEGEPYEDVGIDGVPNTGDYGEGNGKFDYTPGADRMFAQNPRFLIRDMPQGQLDRLNLYVDAGIRDSIVAAAGSNWFWAEVEQRLGTELARNTTSFRSLLPDSKEFDFLAVDFSPEAVGQHLYLRYGSVDASERDVRRGDGGHVGTGEQIINRLLTAIAFAHERLEEPDRRVVADPGELSELVHTSTFFSEAIGEDQPYGVMLPPGYFDTDARYPVIYFLHGQGQEYNEMLASAILWFAYQAGSNREDTQRRGLSDWGKFIMVFPNSVCRDDCYDGTFNTNHPGARKYGDLIYELIAHIDKTYRTRPPEEIPLAGE